MRALVLLAGLALCVSAPIAARSIPPPEAVNLDQITLTTTDLNFAGEPAVFRAVLRDDASGANIRPAAQPRTLDGDRPLETNMTIAQVSDHFVEPG